MEIRDTGSGIPPEHRPRIFDAFYRTRDERGETGDAGTTVRIVLPIAAAADSAGIRVSGRGSVV